MFIFSLIIFCHWNYFWSLSTIAAVLWLQGTFIFLKDLRIGVQCQHGAGINNFPTEKKGIFNREGGKYTTTKKGKNTSCPHPGQHKHLTFKKCCFAKCLQQEHKLISPLLLIFSSHFLAMETCIQANQNDDQILEASSLIISLFWVEMANPRSCQPLKPCDMPHKLEMKDRGPTFKIPGQWLFLRPH